MSLAGPYNDDTTGFKYYFLPVGSILYRGDSNQMGGPVVLDNRVTFFGFDQENVETNYGVAYKFITRVDMKLIALDQNKDTPFYTSLDLDYKKILDENYGYRTGKRDSVSSQDKKISQFICDNYKGYDGYACRQMQTDMGGTFHSEAMICLPKDKLGEAGKVTTASKEEELRNEFKLRRAAPAPKKTRRESLFDRGTSLFGDDESDKENYGSLFNGSLFGGGKRKTKRRKPTKIRKPTKKRI